MTVWVDNKTYEEVLKGKELTVILDSKGKSPVRATIKIKEEDNK